jgi:hypothetical protein
MYYNATCPSFMFFSNPCIKDQKNEPLVVITMKKFTCKRSRLSTIGIENIN